MLTTCILYTALLGTSAIIDRAKENTVFVALSQLHLGPLFYGLFENGRVEGYIPAKSLEPSELADPVIYKAVAPVVYKLHETCIAAIEHDHNFWAIVQKFVDLALGVDINVHVNDEDASPLQHQRLAALQQSLSSELVWLKETLDTYEANHALYLADEDGKEATADGQVTTSTSTSTSRMRGIGYAYEVVLCHNDLLSGNILKAEAAGGGEGGGEAAGEGEGAGEGGHPGTGGLQITLIDYEYCMYNKRGFDIANHFCGKNFMKLVSVKSEELLLLSSHINEFCCCCCCCCCYYCYCDYHYYYYYCC